MPKAFSNEEKELIKSRLIEIGIKYMNDKPINKISVDSLVKDVGISKGAFYLFYENKELLFFDCIMKIHQQMEDKIIVFITNNQQVEGKKLIKDIIITMIKEVEKTPWLLNLDNENYASIANKIGFDKINEHLKDDDLMVKRLLSLLKLKDDNLSFLSAVFRALFLMLLHKKEIGEAVFYQVIEFQIDAVINKVTGE